MAVRFFEQLENHRILRVKPQNTVLFYSVFAEINFRDFEFDQLLTNSFPLGYFRIYLRIFVLSGKIVVEIQFFLQNHLAHYFVYGGVL